MHNSLFTSTSKMISTTCITLNLLIPLVLGDASKFSSPLFTNVLKNTLEINSRTDHMYDSSSGCSPGFFPGTDTVIYTMPYALPYIFNIIGDFANLDYAAGPPQNIHLNGSDNAVGTARFYTTSALPGSTLVEKLTIYSPPSSTQNSFFEVLAFEAFIVSTRDSDTGKESNVTLYGDYDSVTASPTLNGLATTLNYTIHFCATDPRLAAKVSHMAHLGMAEGTNRLLGNRTFKSCPQLQAEGGNGTLGYPRWGGGLMMGTGNSVSGEGAFWGLAVGLVLFFSYLVVLGGGVFHY